MPKNVIFNSAKLGSMESSGVRAVSEGNLISKISFGRIHTERKQSECNLSAECLTEVCGLFSQEIHSEGCKKETCKRRNARWSAKGGVQKEKCRRKRARGECKGEMQEAKCKRWSAKAECKGRMQRQKERNALKHARLPPATCGFKAQARIPPGLINEGAFSSLVGAVQLGVEDRKIESNIVP